MKEWERVNARSEPTYGLHEQTIGYSGAATPPAPALDVERLARAMFRVTVDQPGLLSDVDMLNDPEQGDPMPAARAIAREYAALAPERQ
jgi:hypothetical protein